MVHTSRSKFVVFTVIVPTITLALIVAAIAAPNWMEYSASPATKWGLFNYCSGSSCTKFYGLSPSTISLGSPTCTKNRSDLIDRLNTSAGLILMGAILSFFAFLAQLVHVIGCTIIAKRGHTIIAWTLGIASILAFGGVVIYGATMSYWVACGDSVCTIYNGTTTACGIGYSYVFVIVATIVLFLTAMYVFTYTYKPEIINCSGDSIFVSSAMILLSIVLIAIGVGTDHWHVIVPSYHNSGLFKQCDPLVCTKYDYTAALFTPTPGCSRNWADVAGFNITAIVLLIVSAVVLGLFVLLFITLLLANRPMILFTRTKKLLVISVLILVEALQLTSFILQDNLYDNWLMCGTPLCNAYGSGYCGFGLSYAFILTSMVLTFLMIVVHYFELNNWCCFQERFASGRHTFTMRSAIETITDRTPGKPLGSHGTASQPAPPLPPTATAQAANGSSGREANEPSQREDAGALPQDTTIALPPGEWVFDSVSGYFWCEQIYLFYDPETRQYYDPATDQWITTEAQQQQQGGISGGTSSSTPVRPTMIGNTA